MKRDPKVPPKRACVSLHKCPSHIARLGLVGGGHGKRPAVLND